MWIKTRQNSFRPALLWFSSEQVFHALALGFCFLFFLCLEHAQCTKFCMIFCLQLQTFQKLNLLARARRLLLAPGAKTAPEAAQGVTSSKLGHEPYPVLGSRGQGGDGARGRGSSQGWERVGAGSCSKGEICSELL